MWVLTLFMLSGQMITLPNYFNSEQECINQAVRLQTAMVGQVVSYSCINIIITIGD